MGEQFARGSGGAEAPVIAEQSQKNRHVILMARQCGICGRSRAEALRPLLTNPQLKVFSTLVMDAATARELLK